MSRTWGNPTIDRVFRALGDPVRRHVLYYLQEHSEATLDELATAITGWQVAWSGEGVATVEDRDEMYSMLYHTHLPKLATTGVITYDRDREHVELTDLPAFVESLLDLAKEFEANSRESVPQDYLNAED